MTELNPSLKACEMTEDDFVYLAEDVDALLEDRDKRISNLIAELVINEILSDERIAELQKEIEGLHVALSLP
jgi:hypothetical protein